LVAAAPAAGLAADAYLPVAPKLTGEPIQYLDRLYQDAFIDHEGRAWFLVCGIGLGEAARDAAFDHLVCPDLPGKVIEIPVNNIPLGFDSKGRFWDVTRYGLGCTDAATGEFSERDVAPGKSPDQLAKPHPSQPDFKPGFARVMLEHSSGRLYFIDSYGLHVLDGGTWSYQLFDPAPTWLAVRGDPVKIAECPDGNVAVWGKVGLWTHDGKSWRRHSSQPYELAPLADGQSLVMIEANSMGRVCRLRLKDDKPATVPSPDPLTARWPGFKHILTLPRGVSLIDGYDTSLSRHVLADMQRRWADPNGNRWKLGGEQTSREMCELFHMDPRRSSLYQWLKGRRGPGDLPYAGYQAATQPATAPAGAAPAGAAPARR
jgi:hypothetical protein